jgi:hypothetical protein
MVHYKNIKRKIMEERFVLAKGELPTHAIGDELGF